MYTIKEYQSDTGNRDSGKELQLPNYVQLHEVLKKAVELRALLIVKTSYMSVKRPGAWYIKWIGRGAGKDQISGNTIEKIVLDNLRNGKFSKRQCFVIKYDDLVEDE